MSDLQIMLIVIGALIIVAVIIVNWWQERRFHQQIERSFSNLESDALLDDPKIDVSKLDTSKLDTPEFDAANEYASINDSNMDHFTFDNEQPKHTFHDEIDLQEADISQNNAPKQEHSERFVKLTQHDDEADRQSESVAIDAEFSQRTNEIYNDLSLRKPDSDNQLEPAGELKPANHVDIKAIFNEAFSQTNKTTSANENEPVAQVLAESASNLQALNLNSNPIESATAQTTGALSSIDSNANATNISAANTSTSNMDSADIGLPDTAPNNTQPQTSADILELSLPTMLHAQMDLTAVLYLATETAVSTLNNSLLGLFDDFDKPIFVHALVTNPDGSSQWASIKEISHKINADQKISRVTCSLQLADRGGAVSRNVLNRFQLAVETFGLDINAHVEWQSTDDALATATALDTFCIEVDKTIGFHLIHGENGAFTGTKLRGLAEAQGFTLDSDGTFKYFITLENPSESHEKTPFSFMMFNRDNHPFSPEMLRNSVVKGVTFQLDVPHVKSSSEAFTQMVLAAKQMESSLNAVLVDDNNKVLTDTQIEKIRHQLKVIHATMSVRGIIPGSDSALRLFS